MLYTMRAQTTVELTFLVLVAVAAVVGMQLYVRRGLQARYKGLVDVISTEVTPTGENTTTQYEPYYINSVTTTSAGRTLTTNTNGWDVERNSRETRNSSRLSITDGNVPND